ncbi:hypothetical protein MMC29_000386 [Sticta canariensis]|nr:hypothetical protein [Sticta canariensis]
MSSESREEVVSQALEAGAAEYLVKPIRRRELTNLWQHVPQQTSSTAPEGRTAPGASGPSTQPPPASPSQAQPAAPFSTPSLPPAQPCMPRIPPSSSTPAPASVPPSVPEDAPMPASLPTATLLSTWPLNGIGSAPFARQLSERLEANPISSVDLEIKPLDLRPTPRSSLDVPSASASEGDADMADARQRASSHPIGHGEWGKRLDESFKKLHHSKSASAFSSFTSVVPRPCPRGEDSEQPLDQVTLCPQLHGYSGVLARLYFTIAAPWQASAVDWTHLKRCPDAGVSLCNQVN